MVDAGAMHSPRLLQAYLHASGTAVALPAADLVGRYSAFVDGSAGVFQGIKTDLLRKTTAWFNDDFAHSSVQSLGFGQDVPASLIPVWVPRRLARFCCERVYGFFCKPRTVPTRKTELSPVAAQTACLF